MTTHKSDVWSACVTMMNVFIGETVNKDAREQVQLYCVCVQTRIYTYVFTYQFNKFIKAATEGTKTATMSVTESLILLESIISTVWLMQIFQGKIFKDFSTRVVYDSV